MPPREVELPLPAHLTPIRRRFTQGAHLELLLGAFEVAAGLKNYPKNTRNLENRPRKAAKPIENPCGAPPWSGSSVGRCAAHWRCAASKARPLRGVLSGSLARERKGPKNHGLCTDFLLFYWVLMDFDGVSSDFLGYEHVSPLETRCHRASGLDLEPS